MLFRQCLPTEKLDLHRLVPPDIPVGLPFDLGQVLRGDYHVEVDHYRVLPQVESHILTAVASTDYAADNVLPAVLLHVVEPDGDIHLPRHLRSHRDGPITEVDDLPVLFPHIPDADAA